MNSAQKEDLRHVCLEILALREGSALTARQVCRRSAEQLDFPITDDDCAHALQFLKGLTPALVSSETDGLGATVYWQITSPGLLAHERGEVPKPPHAD